MDENTEDFRRAVKNQHAKAQLDEAHVRNCRVLPDRGVLLERLPKGGVAAEIGVAFGEFTDEILSRNRPCELHLIDLWASARYKKGFARIADRFKGKLKDGSLVIHRGKSTEVLPRFGAGTFDWVYIDTDHSYWTTKQELEMSRNILKTGGRIAGHDFTSGNIVKPWPYGVIEACNEFCVGFGWEFEFLTLESHGHFSFCLRKI